ncbi:hypothetical protein V5799_004630, partial [Amblyomma americanum]
MSLLALAAFLVGLVLLIIVLWLKFYYTVGYCETQSCLDHVRELKRSMDTN